MTIHLSRKRKLPRRVAFALRGLALLLVGAALAADIAYLSYSWHHFALVERDEWLADYDRVKNLIETRYPNLDWAVTEGRLDLYRLDLRTKALLEDADSKMEAERVLRDFVRAFHDGHLYLRPPDPDEKRRRGATISASTSGEKACESLGYERSDDAELRLEFKGSAPSRPLSGVNPFAAALLRVDRRKMGLLRIPSFDPSDYFDTCVSEWDRFRTGLETTCEWGCEAQFHNAMTARLLDELGERIGQMQKAGIELLVVDVTGNGGGYEDFRRGATTLLAGRELPEPEEAIAANDETVKSLQEERRKLERALALCPGGSAARKTLESEFWRLDAAIAEAGLPCDRSAVWSDWGARPGCPALVSFRSLDDQTVAEINSVARRSAGVRLGDALNRPALPRWRGPLAVLTNRYTGSAAEMLVGVLRDFAGATILGQRTSGSGGGWMFGQSYWRLEHSGLELYIPDHVTYRADGTSYRAGVTPDIPVRFDPRDEDTAKARALVEGLRRMSGPREETR